MLDSVCHNRLRSNFLLHDRTQSKEEKKNPHRVVVTCKTYVQVNIEDVLYFRDNNIEIDLLNDFHDYRE